MNKKSFPALDITDHWARLNDELARLVDCVPDEQIEWSPRPELWNFRRVLTHIAGARDYWMGSVVKDGDPAKSVHETARSKDEIKREYRRTWERVQRFLADPAKLSKVHESVHEGREFRVSGHWIAFHLLEHDIHHRADIFHYLALLGIEHPEVGTP